MAKVIGRLLPIDWREMVVKLIGRWVVKLIRRLVTKPLGRLVAKLIGIRGANI